MPDPHNPLNRPVGELEERKYRDDFFSNSTTDFLNGPGSNTEFVTPSFGPGEVWDLRIQVSFSSEITDDVAIVRLMNEAEDTVIVRRVIDTFEKNHFELRAIVTDEDVGATGSRSPDLQVEFVGNDAANYFITCRGIRLRRQSDTNDRNDDGSGSQTADRLV